MILNMTGGGASPFAFILVTYPEGSTVTCTNSNGKKDISDTQRLFYIRKGTVPFNCVVTATDGTHTAFKTVSIEYEGQSVSINLSYEYIVFDATTPPDKSAAFGTGTGSASSTVANVGTTIELATTGSTDIVKRYVAVYTNGKINLSDYSRLKVSFSTEQVHSAMGSFAFGVSSALDNFNTPGATKYAAFQTSAKTVSEALTDTTEQYDISSITGSYHIAAMINACRAVITKIWLE